MGIYDRILITGAGGMLAKAFARTLQTKSHQPILLMRAELDINSADVARAFEQHRPTLVINCAAYTKVDLAEEQIDLATAVNAHGPGNLAREAAKHGSKLVHFSTDFVFDGKSTRPYRPDDTTNPLSAYGSTKAQGEEQIRAAARDALIIRTAWLYGPGGPCFPQTILNAAKAGKPLRVVNDQTGTPTYTHDLADATLALLDAGANGTFHFTNSGQTTWFDFTRAILDEFKVTADLQSISSADWQKIRPKSAIRPAYSVLDTSDYTRVTGKTVRPWPEGLAAYHQALRSTT